jgi:hypothetical protein
VSAIQIKLEQILVKKMQETQPSCKSELFLKSSDQFRTALRRVINQSAVTASGDAKPIPRQALSALAGIAPSTLNKFLVSDEKAREEPPNPTLEVICKLGEALNVPPALLLMTDDDWKKLGNAIGTYMTTLVHADKFQKYVGNTVLEPDYAGRASDIARDAFEIAKMCGFGVQATNAAKTTIASTSQTLPFRELSPEHRPLLMVVCAVFALSARQPSVTSTESV